MTTKTLAEIERNYRNGLNDEESAELAGVSPASVSLWRKGQGFPPNRKYRKSILKRITVYERSTTQYLCEGTMEECAKSMRMTVGSLKTSLWRYKSGRTSHYEFHECVAVV